MRQISEEQAYAQELVKKLQEGSEDLTDTEKKLGRRYLESQQIALQASQEAEQVEKQIVMGQNRLAQLRNSITAEMGKSSGILESLISLRPSDWAGKKDNKGNGEAKPAVESKEEAHA